MAETPGVDARERYYRGTTPLVHPGCSADVLGTGCAPDAVSDARAVGYA
jgi:hypothetical protein